MPAAPAKLIRSMHLDDKTTSHVEFESAHARGRIEISPDVLIGYESRSVTKQGSTTSTEQRTRLTINGQLFTFDGPELTIGEKRYGKLVGEVLIRIAKDGVTVNGEKRGEL